MSTKVRLSFVFALFLWCLPGLFLSAIDASGQTHTNVQTVFLIVMENVSWSSIKGSGSAPYINNVLLPMASYCQQYYSPTSVASSLPNYFWLEGGTNYGITDSGEPSTHVITSTNHLVTQLNNAGISWKCYQEDISGTNCPVKSTGLYAAYHNPHVYFTDIISNAPYCLSHIRPYTELAGDLQSNHVARYNFITPNLCDDMHGAGSCATDRIRLGDNWLSVEVARIMNSAAYSNNGAIFITWDESDLPPRASPIGMIVLSPLAKGGGYSNTNFYNHASALRTMQEIFGVRPLLFAANSVDSLSDLFRPTIFLQTPLIQSNGQFQFTVRGVGSGKTNLIQASTNLANWSTLSTNLVSTNSLIITDPAVTNSARRYYRVLQFH